MKKVDRPTNRGTAWKTTSQRGKDIAKATVFAASLLVALTTVVYFLGCFESTTFPGFTLPRKTPFGNQEFPHRCYVEDVVENQTRHIPLSGKKLNRSRRSTATCPSYFRWIHEDLRPWKETGITKDMVERAKKTAHIRVVILDGKVYVKKYRKAIQTRDVFTIWGILQLLRWYPGRLPDLELMFDCGDRPTVRSIDFKGQNAGPPPLFRYCSNDSSLDIVFPDWSFWGWAEVNMAPWGKSMEAIRRGKKKSQWKDRIPYAYWRGNPYVDPTRVDLLKCNSEDWNTHLYIQDWDTESKEGFKNSDIENQCTHRYKIYIEGWAWSVSEKYIMACDSMTLYVKPRFYDFYVRGMMPLQHYWPIRDDSKCTSLKFAVHWGNSHVDKARAIGESGSRYLQEDVTMEFVYDYMFHLLNEYSKLLRFTPTIPRGAMEITPENMGCPATGRWKEFMAEAMVMSPRQGSPCAMPPPYDPLTLQAVLHTKARLTRQVEDWEDDFFRELNNN